jgi:hypothetical protein
MENSAIRRFTRITKVENFGKENAADFAGTSKATALFHALGHTSQQLKEANVGQLRVPVGKPERIKALSTDFKGISRTARAIKIDEPEFDSTPYDHPGSYAETDITTHADSLLKRLESNPAAVLEGGDPPALLASKAVLRAQFIAYEIAADFVEDLRADRDALDDCNSAKHSDNQEGIESTSAIETLLSEAQSIITRLDSAVRNKYHNNPDKLSVWASASHVERPARSDKKPQPSPVLPLA